MSGVILRGMLLMVRTTEKCEPECSGVVVGRNLFPATGYLSLVWETVAMMLGRLTPDTAIVFENVKFLRATTVPKDGSMELYVMVQRASGNFEVILVLILGFLYNAVL